jgi:signal transduction histidine kinase/CheY-like chemotaxis protein
VPMTGSSPPPHSWHRRFEARVVVAVGVLVAASLGAVLAATTRAVTSRSLERASTDLEATRVAFNHLVDDRAGFASSQASLVTALPVFRAHMTDAQLAGDLPTLEALAAEYRLQLKADFIIIADPAGHWTAVTGWPAGKAPAAAIRGAIDESTAGRPARDFVPAGDHLYLVVSEPARFADEVLGTLTVGYALDDAVATRLAQEANCDVNIAAGGVLFASSLPTADRAALVSRLASDDFPRGGAVTRVGASDYVVGAFPLSSNKSIHGGRLVLLQNWRPTAEFVDEIRRGLLATGAAVLAIALAGSFVLSRRMSQPLRDLARAATDIAGGNWERQVPLSGSVEATMTADAFNAMTTSLRHWHEEAKKRDDALRQAQKLEALGRLAGGIAHDFNNLLMAMRGYAELLLQSMDSDPRQEEVQEIINAADRAATLTKQLLAFSRRQAVATRVLALDKLVARAEQMLRRVIGAQIALTTIVPDGLDAVRADAGQLEQVVMNLSINARDAMPDGGRLRIELANIAEDDTARPAQLAPGRYVRLSVADTGSGMTPETRARIFEPFFTTKDVGLGTGLGLAMVYGIVEQSGGAIDVETALGHGTAFHIYLPAVKDVASEQADVEAPGDGSRTIQNNGGVDHAHKVNSVNHINNRGSETVLLVEDEARLGTFIAGALRSRGYTVLEAANAEEALVIVRANPAPIHLLLTDVVMPGINGRELSELVVGMHGNTRVLFMSGYSADAVLRHGIEAGSAQFLQKPFSIDALTTKIRETLS